MPRYIVYLRVPYPRSGNESAPVIWSHREERQLWGELQKSKNDPDWKALAATFDVPVQYILQQAAWLYEKELKVLKRRMTQLHASSIETGTRDFSLEADSIDSKPKFNALEPFDSSNAIETDAIETARTFAQPESASNSPSQAGRTEEPRFGDNQLLSTTRDFTISCESLDDDGDGFALPDMSCLTQSDVSKSSDGSLTRSALEEAFNQCEARTTASSGTASNFEA